jgi:hypothetical protein
MRSAIAMDRALAGLGTPPAVSDDYVTPLITAIKALTPPMGDLGMFLNDSLGDCVCADSCHQIMLHSANGSGLVVPTDADCLALYEAVGGYVPGNPSTDQGCDEVSMCEYLMATGLCGEKIAGSGSIDPANLTNLRWGVQIFGTVRLGIVVGQDFIQQFTAGQPWVAPTTDPNAGGHDVPVVKYDADYAYVITWGGLQAVSWSLMANTAFLDEVHAEVWPDFIASTGSAPNGFNLAQLLADLPAVEQAA